MSNLPKEIKQFELNYICSCLLFCRIRTSVDLTNNFSYLIKQIDNNKDIFKDSYTKEEWIAIFQQGLKIYNASLAYNIQLSERQKIMFKATVEQARPSVGGLPIPENDDLSNVTRSYDRLIKAHDTKKIINNRIQALIDKEVVLTIPQVIFGAGDTGTTLWLERFKEYHGKTLEFLTENKPIPVLMVAEDAGSWHHNYTLGQPYSILERTTGIENPSAYISRHYHEKNPHVNGRHLYQANQVNLGLTQAPLLQATVLKLEKQANHQEDWQVDNYPYRLIIQTASGKKYVYAQEVNICTGLGPAKNIIADTFLKKEEFVKLNQFDEQKQFTPIIDGNDFILTGREEKKNGKTIVVYGGGGTATACYRKGFFGTDLHTQDREFINEHQRNRVLWVSAGSFRKAGTGNLVTTAMNNAELRNELYYGKLESIKQAKDGKLILTFKRLQDSQLINQIPDNFTLECDQFIYSVGQDNSHIRAICKEVEDELALLFDDEDKMVLNVSSKDKKILFFGAAAVAIREKEYMSATWTWLKAENISADIGPGSMPSSRAQIKRYIFLQDRKVDNINANVDCKNLIFKFLEETNVPKVTALNFVNDLLKTRKENILGGVSHNQLRELLARHKLDNCIEIMGHGHLVKKPLVARTMRPTLPLLSWIGANRQTVNASIRVSSISVNSKTDQGASSVNVAIKESSINLKV